MDADRRNNFNNNKSVGAVATQSVIENGGSSHTTTNGTISSSTESSDSVEPPKQSFNDNINKDFHENNVCVEQYKSEQCNRIDAELCTDSVKSNDKDSNDLCNILSVGNENGVSNVGLDDSRNFNLNSMSTRAQTQTNNHDKNSSIDKQLNGNDKNCNRSNVQEACVSNGLTIDMDDYQKSRNDENTDNADTTTIITSHNEIDKQIDKTNINGQRINNSANEFDASINSNTVDTVTNTLHDNQLSSVPENQIESNQTTAKLLQNSSEDCISTDTISSNSIDVKPIKCPTDRSQTASESEEIGCKNIEEEQSNDIPCETNQSTKSTMYDDNTLKMPLLGKNATSEKNGTTVYSAINRPNVSKQKGNFNENATDDDKCDAKSVAYNEYVNLLCDTDRNGGSSGVGSIFTKNAKRNGSAESRPLLRQTSCDDGSINQKIQRRSNPRPRSIVKSPSTQNFSSNTGDKFDVNRKPRLSIQCTGSDPERPVLHVQFLSQQHNDSTDSIKRNLLNSVNSPSSGEHESYQNGGSQCDSTMVEKQPEELIHQMPARGILRTSRLRSSISSSSSDSTSSSSDSSSSDDVSQFAEAKPPDGGYGWVIVFASFMVNVIADGITFSFGVIYVELLKYFGEGKAKTAWIGSLFMAMPLLSGPVASFLTDRFGCRRVTIIGSVLGKYRQTFFTFSIFYSKFDVIIKSLFRSSIDWIFCVFVYRFGGNAFLNIWHICRFWLELMLCGCCGYCCLLL